MSLVEGHAEYVMNSVLAGRHPDPAEIERRFAQRRRTGVTAGPAAAQLLGIGGQRTRHVRRRLAFVRAVVERIGLDDFTPSGAHANAAEQGRDRCAAQWIARVHA